LALFVDVLPTKEKFTSLRWKESKLILSSYTVFKYTWLY